MEGCNKRNGLDFIKLLQIIKGFAAKNSVIYTNYNVFKADYCVICFKNIATCFKNAVICFKNIATSFKYRVFKPKNIATCFKNIAT